MGMNNRTLRPSATGFSPRSISGLALWLDGSDTASLYTTDAGPVTAVASPLDVATPALWLDASDAASITESGGLVSQWNDKSGNARHATASGSNRPTRTAAAQNGRAVLTFDGTSSQMQIDSTFLVTSNATIFAVARRTSGSFGAVITSKGTGDTSPALQHSSGAWQINHAGNLSIIGTTVGYAVLSGTISAGATAAYANGLIQDSDASSGALSSDATKTYIGTYRAAVANVLAGDIAEIIVYPTALSTTDRARVEAYLGAKWGISGVHAPATASSDPVGYWGDKSGNGRHAVQATAGNRPVVGTQNGRRALTFDGTDDCLSADVAPSSLCSTSGGVAFYVAVPNNDTAWSAFTNAGPVSHIDRFSDGASYHGNFRASRFSGITSGAYSSAGAQLIVSRANASTGLQTIRKDGATIYSAAENITGYRGLVGTAAVNVGATVTAISPSVTRAHFLAGSIPEILCYSSPLTDSQITAIERYLATRWGITLAPQVANADAQDWVNRVYANGGTVSTATAGAVNTFCESIASAGIRDRFYRLNLFCGTGLNAALVPLYRAASLGGTQLGSVTDTNAGGLFVSGDYAETGATGGLLGNGSSKYLNTGLEQSNIPLTNLHTSASLRNGETSFGTENTLIGHYDVSQADFVSLRQAVTTGSREFFAGSFSGASTAAAASVESHILGVRSSATSSKLYRAGLEVGSSSSNIGTPSTSSRPYFVFARNNSGTPTNYTSARLRMYSIGTAMDAANALAFSTAVAAFNAALDRA